MDQPKDQRTFIDFKQKLVTQIEEPSDHTVMGTFSCFVLFCFVLLRFVLFCFVSIIILLAYSIFFVFANVFTNETPVSLFLSHTQTHKHTHTLLSVRLNGEKHIIKSTANGKNTSSMSKLVLDNICQTIVGNSNQIEKRRQKQEGEEESIVPVVVAMDLLKIYKWISKILMI